MWGRLERLRKAFRPDLAQPDDGWALTQLAQQQGVLYSQMDVRDREHAVAVAKRLLKHYPQAPSYVVQAALLHDAGKALRPYRPLERILSGLFAPSLPPQPLYTDWRGAWQIRRHHPEYAAQRIADPQVAALVLEHHRPQSLWGKRLHEMDGEF